MPRGRKKCQTRVGGIEPMTRISREGSEESSTAEDAPKIKDSRLDHFINATANTSPKSRLRSRITDYFSPSPPRAPSLSPPHLLPQIPLALEENDEGQELAADAEPPVLDDDSPAALENDVSSDRSEGDSGKENEEDPGEGHNRAKGNMGAKPKSNSVMTARNKQPEPSRVATRSSSGGKKIPLLNLSYSRLNPDHMTPPHSPVKNVSAASSPSVVPPKSPPTPHKIKFLGNEKSPAASALQKLKLSFTTKSNNHANSPSETMKGPKKSAETLKPSNGVRVTTTTTSKSKSKSTNKDKLEKSASGSHKVTEYFQIRRSERRPKAVLEKEHLEDIEHHLLAQDDSDLSIATEQFPEKGRGVVACKNFEKGEFVVEYAGDLIDVGIARERETKYSLDLSTGCYMYYFKHKGKQYCIDATGESGRLGRLVNHSRLHPNLQTKVVVFKDKPRLILTARKEIEAGSELLYDYGDRSKESLKAHPWLAL